MRKTLCALLLLANSCTAPHVSRSPQSSESPSKIHTTREGPSGPSELERILFPSVFVRPMRTWERFGNKIYTIPYSLMGEVQLTPEKIQLPHDLEFALRNVRKYDESVVESLTHSYCRSKQICDESVSALKPKEAVQLAVDCVSFLLRYHNVDEDQEFISRYGENLPIDRYLSLGLGDCDKYASAVDAVFEVFKKKNPALVNVYIGHSTLGGFRERSHDWNSIIMVTPQELYVSHIDPTFFDNGESLEATGFHLSTDQKCFLGWFYYGVGDYERSFGFQRDCLDTLSGEDKKIVVHNLAFTAWARKDLERLREAESLARLAGLVKDDSLMFYLYDTLSKRNDPQAEEYRTRLLQDFPDSYWVKKFMRE